MPVGEKNGEIITGFYKPRSHDIIDDMDTCLIQHDIGNDILAEIRILANELGISAYNEREHKGTLRHIIIRTGYETDEVMVTFVTNTKDLPHSNKIIKRRIHDNNDDMDTCLIQHDIGNDILAEIRILANELGISAYNEREHKGTLRHIIIRTGYETDEVMVTFVTNTKDLPHSNKIIK